jgi:hypothetical protein
MAVGPRYPSLFEINTRVWLERLSRDAGKQVTLAGIDDTTLDSFAERGCDWIWLRLKERHVGPIRDHLVAGLDYQD